MKLFIIIFILIFSTSCRDNAQTSQTDVIVPETLDTINIGVIGNSIACGKMANDLKGNVFDNSTMLSGSYAYSFTGVKGDSMLSSFGPHTPVEGWVNQLYAYLLTANDKYKVINLCGAGWDTLDQLGAYSEGSGKFPVNDNVGYFANMINKPKYVLIALQVNDWGHSRGIQFFEKNTRVIIQKLRDANIEPIMVIESPIYNNQNVLNVAGNYNDDTVNYSGAYNYSEKARSLAVEYGLKIIDFYTPIDNLAREQNGSSYGEKLVKTHLYWDTWGNTPVHPNQEGNNIMANAAIDFFKSLIDQ